MKRPATSFIYSALLALALLGQSLIDHSHWHDNAQDQQECQICLSINLDKADLPKLSNPSVSLPGSLLPANTGIARFVGQAFYRLRARAPPLY